MENIRQQKVSRLIMKEMGDIFLKKTGKEIPGTLVSVTKVKTTPDLQLVRVYLSIFGKADKDQVVEMVNQRKAEFRGMLGSRIGKQIRYIPQLDFYLDDTLDYIDNIEKLLGPSKPKPDSE